MYLTKSRISFFFFFGRIAIWNCRRRNFFFFLSWTSSKERRSEVLESLKRLGINKRREELSAWNCRTLVRSDGNRKICLPIEQELYKRNCRIVRSRVCHNLGKWVLREDRSSSVIQLEQSSTETSGIVEIPKKKRIEGRKNATERKRRKRREEAKSVTEREKEPEATTIERNCRGIAREFQRFERANEHWTRVRDKQPFVDRSIEELPIFLHLHRSAIPQLAVVGRKTALASLRWQDWHSSPVFPPRRKRKKGKKRKKNTRPDFPDDRRRNCAKFFESFVRGSWIKALFPLGAEAKWIGFRRKLRATVKRWNVFRGSSIDLSNFFQPFSSRMELRYSRYR